MSTPNRIRIVAVVRDGILDEVYSNYPELVDVVTVDVDLDHTEEPIIVKAAETDRYDGHAEVEGWLRELQAAGGERVVLDDEGEVVPDLNTVPQGPRAE